MRLVCIAGGCENLGVAPVVGGPTRLSGESALGYEARSDEWARWRPSVEQHPQPLMVEALEAVAGRLTFFTQVEPLGRSVAAARHLGEDPRAQPESPVQGRSGSQRFPPGNAPLEGR